MSDEFVEHDLDTPTEADLDQAYGSKFLSAADIGNRKVRTKIVKVRKEELRGNDGTKRVRFVLYFEGIDKGLVLNGVNKDRLVASHGKVPARWIGASVGIYVDPDVVFGGKKTGGIRLRVMEPFQAKPVPAAKSKPVSKPVVTEEAPQWPDQEGDPGPEYIDTAE